MLTLAAVFSDHMVLQRRKPVPVWGTGDAGASVHITLGTQHHDAVIAADGSWQVWLEEQEAGGPYSLTVESGGVRLTCEDVMLGEVWLAGGQSNMELALKDSRNGKREVAQSGGKNVRFYNLPKRAVLDEEQARMEAESGWQVCSPQTSGEMSAVAYYFACQIAESQKVTVGVIDCYWGGTSISCWMSRSQLEKTKAGQRYLDDYAALVGDKTDEDYQREMDAYNAEYEAWCSRVDAQKALNPRVTWEVLNEVCGLCPWPQPAGNQSPFRPAGLYETMLRRVCPYGIRGFLYYQGEEDSNVYFRTYAEMMELLIDQWRTDWAEDSLPFLFVQLPMYVSKEAYQAHADDLHWPYVRDEQMKISRTVANTGLAVLTDCGEFDNIHPLDKETVGFRLALQARQKVYGEPILADGPQKRTVRREGSEVVVTFDHTAGRLVIQGDTLEGFQLAGRDGVYYPARGSVRLDTVRLRCDQVPEPESVRYAWFNYGPANLYNAAGLAAAPFRTDRQQVN